MSNLIPNNSNSNGQSKRIVGSEDLIHSESSPKIHKAIHTPNEEIIIENSTSISPLNLEDKPTKLDSDKVPTIIEPSPPLELNITEANFQSDENSSQISEYSSNHVSLDDNDSNKSDGDDTNDNSSQYSIEDWSAEDIDEKESNIKPLPFEKTLFLQLEARRLGANDFVQEYLEKQKEPILQLLDVFGVHVPPIAIDLEESYLKTILLQSITKFLGKRQRLLHINSFEDVVELIQKSKKIMVLTGAGVSVSCGIPDFRSSNGIYTKLGKYNLSDPQQMFDLEYFRIAPEIFYSFAKEIYPSNFKPSPSHMFIKLLENKDKLLRNYTQNIDTIESIAGIKKVLNCHGSFASSSCILCHTKYPGDFIKKEIFEQKVPYCPACLKKRSDDEGLIPPVIKPDIVFFGEDLPDEFDQSFIKDREELDLLIVMGSSLKVAPVSEIMNYLPANVPQILINRTPNYDAHFDVQLIGYSDTIVQILCDKLGWELPDTPREPIPEIEASFEDLIRLPHYWHRFPGAQLDPAEFLDIESEEDDWNQEVSSEMQEIDVISIAMESEHLDGTQGSSLPLNGNLNSNPSQSTNEQQEN